MAEDNIDEIEKLRAKLRHLVPRATNNACSVGHRDLSRDSSSSIRFPSLFTFPVISNSNIKSERVRKSAAQLNLNDKLSSDNRPSTVNLRKTGRLGSSAKGLSIFKDTLNSDNTQVKSHKDSYLNNSSSSRTSISAARPKKSTASSRPTRNIIANREVGDLQIIKRGLKNEASRTTVRGKTRHTTGEKSSVCLPATENNANSKGRRAFNSSNGVTQK